MKQNLMLGMCLLCVLLHCVFGLKVLKKSVRIFSVFLLRICLVSLPVLLPASLRYFSVCLTMLVCVFLLLSVLNRVIFILVLILTIMSRSNIEYLDIFHQPIKRTYVARVREFSELVKQLKSANILVRPDRLGEFSYLCHAGYVSARVASYFLADRVSDRDRNVLSSFLNFLKDYEAITPYDTLVHCSLNYLSSWSKVNNVAEANTFLFPLEELASNDPLFGTSFESEI